MRPCGTDNGSDFLLAVMPLSCLYLNVLVAKRLPYTESGKNDQVAVFRVWSMRLSPVPVEANT